MAGGEQGLWIGRLDEHLERGVIEAQRGHDRVEGDGKQTELDELASGVELAGQAGSHRFLADALGRGLWAKTSR